MASEAVQLKPGRYILSSRQLSSSENNVIGIKEHLLFKEGTTAHEEPRVPVMYMPRPFRIPAWEVEVVGNGRYTMELDGFKVVGDTSSGLVFADKKGAEIWAIKPQQKDKEFPFELYTIESVNEPGIGWFVVDNPDVNTQISYGHLGHSQVDTAHYATTALWFFIPDDARAPISV
ncbi:hypothetical protein AMATHDRAFT_71193, partial [Amanita thiersii Skay4041]